MAQPVNAYFDYIPNEIFDRDNIEELELWRDQYPEGTLIAKNGETLLMSSLESVAICAHLIKEYQGTDYLNREDNKGRTVLHILAGVCYNDIEKAMKVGRMLIAAGADVNKRDHNGNTPLGVLVRSRLGNCVAAPMFLLSGGTMAPSMAITNWKMIKCFVELGSPCVVDDQEISAEETHCHGKLIKQAQTEDSQWNNTWERVRLLFIGQKDLQSPLKLPPELTNEILGHCTDPTPSVTGPLSQQDFDKV